MNRKKAKIEGPTRRLFSNPSGQVEIFEKSIEEEIEERATKTVQCFGQTFPNDNARRAHYLEILRERLKDSTFRQTDGFPVGSDEDILRLSDPPYYTACPNPFIEDCINTTLDITTRISNIAGNHSLQM
jgi:hypothetical protein